jgi:hypothetical protein
VAALRQAGNLSRGQQNTRKILKRKKRTDTQYDNTARVNGQRLGKLKIGTWNIRGITGKTEELKTELMKRKIGIVKYFVRNGIIFMALQIQVLLKTDK